MDSAVGVVKRYRKVRDYFAASDQEQNVRSSTEEKSSVDSGVRVEKKYRKVRDYFGKRPLSSMEGASGAEKSSDENSSDSAPALPSPARQPAKMPSRGPALSSTPNNRGQQGAIAGPSNDPKMAAREKKARRMTKRIQQAKAKPEHIVETKLQSMQRTKWERDLQLMFERKRKKAAKDEGKAKPTDSTPKEVQESTPAAAKRKRATPKVSVSAKKPKVAPQLPETTLVLRSSNRKTKPVQRMSI